MKHFSIIIIAALTLFSSNTNKTIAQGKQKVFNLTFTDDDTQFFESVRMGLNFDDPFEATESSLIIHPDLIFSKTATISFESDSISVFKTDGDNTKLAVDSNGDGEIESAEIVALNINTPTTFNFNHTETETDYTFGVNKKDNDSFEYWIPGYLKTTLSVNDEELGITVKILSGGNRMYFLDTDNDAVYDVYHQSDYSK